MIRIKLFKEFITESIASEYDDKFGITPKLESDIKDIFVELRDLRFEVDVQRWIATSNVICVTLSPIDVDSTDSIKISEIKEYAMMLIDYMKIKYSVKNIRYTVCLGDFDRGDTMLYNYDEFPDEVADLDTDEFCMDFEVDDYEISEDFINEGFGVVDKSIKSDINDIFLELVDDGFKVDINLTNYNSYDGGSFYFYIENEKQFRVDDVREYVMMLNDYMAIKFKDFTITYRLDYMHSNPITMGSYDYFPTGCTYDINNLLVQYYFGDTNESYTNEGLVNEGFGDFSETDYDKIESDINDMFIELKDSGAKVNIDFYHKGVGYGAGVDDYMIKVRINSDRQFNMKDVEEPTRMMVDYFQDLTDKKVDMEYNMSSDYTNTRQREFNPYSFDNGVTIYLIERG